MPLPTVILLGFFASASEYQSLEFALNQQGILTVTVPLRRRNGLPTLGGRSMAPILPSLERAVKQVLQQYNTDRVNLIGHSAGGWLARIYLGEKLYNICRERESLWDARDRVATLVTLGTPHLSQER